MSTRKTDDLDKRRQFREQTFDGKRSTEDAYTGERIFWGNDKDAVHKHPSYKTSDSDHITTIQKIDEWYPDLTVEQRKELANLSMNVPQITKDGLAEKELYLNYAMTNSSLNRKKGGKTNIEYLKNEWQKGEIPKKELVNQAAHMIPKQMVSEACIGIAGTGMRLQNMMTSLDVQKMHEVGMSAAGSTALFAGTAAVVQNLYAVAQQEKTVGEAAKDTAVTAAKAAAAAYVHGAVMHQIGKVVPAGADALITGVVLLSDTVKAYASGEIAEDEFVEKIAENAAYLVAAQVGRGIGTVIGNAILPGVGGIVGGVLGEIVTTAVCHDLVDSLKFYKNAEKELSHMQALCAHAESEIKAAQSRMQELMKLECCKLLGAIDEGFSMIEEAVMTNDIGLMKKGLLTIGTQFGLTEEYLQEGELTMENLFSTDDTVLVIV